MNIKNSLRLMNLAMKARVPYLLVGHSGIGKSQITEQQAKDVFPNHKFVSIFASQQDVGDFIGIPDIMTVEVNDNTGKRKAQRVTSWARPEWMPYEPCVIFLDELNNARPDVESAMLQLVLEKRIHTHTLHPDSYICAAINPASSEYSTANTMTTALVKRFMVIGFEPENEEFLKWGEDSKRVHPRLLSFLKHHPIQTGAEKKLETLIKLEPCPRLWTEAVSKIYSVMEVEGKANDRELLTDLISSTLGTGTAGVFLNWLDTQDKPLSFKEIIDNPKKAIKRFKEFNDQLRNDLISGSVENIIKGWSEAHEGLVGKVAYKTSVLELERNPDKDLFAKAKKELHKVLDSKATEEVRGQLDAFITFMQAMPNDIMYQISHAIITYKPFVENNGLDNETYHKKQIERFDAYNTMVWYSYRDDFVEGRKGLGLYDKFDAAVAELEKHKKKDTKESDEQAD